MTKADRLKRYLKEKLDLGLPFDPYKYRNLPCSENGVDYTWYVAGADSSKGMVGAGVLEWCYDQQDAEDRIGKMREHTQFDFLAVKQWDKYK